MDAPNEFQPLMDDIFREKVLRTRQWKVPGVLSLEGFDLFDTALTRIRGSVRSSFPEATEEEVEKEVKRRLQVKRRLDEHGIYRAMP